MFVCRPFPTSPLRLWVRRGRDFHSAYLKDMVLPDPVTIGSHRDMSHYPLAAASWLIACRTPTGYTVTSYHAWRGLIRLCTQLSGCSSYAVVPALTLYRLTPSSIHTPTHGRFFSTGSGSAVALPTLRRVVPSFGQETSPKLRGNHARHAVGLSPPLRYRVCAMSSRALVGLRAQCSHMTAL